MYGRPDVIQMYGGGMYGHLHRLREEMWDSKRTAQEQRRELNKARETCAMKLEHIQALEREIGDHLRPLLEDARNEIRSHASAEREGNSTAADEDDADEFVAAIAAASQGVEEEDDDDDDQIQDEDVDLPSLLPSMNHDSH